MTQEFTKADHAKSLDELVEKRKRPDETIEKAHVRLARDDVDYKKAYDAAYSSIPDRPVGKGAQASFDAMIDERVKKAQRTDETYEAAYARVVQEDPVAKAMYSAGHR